MHVYVKLLETEAVWRWARWAAETNTYVRRITFDCISQAHGSAALC